jgi:hypothetical protein
VRLLKSEHRLAGLAGPFRVHPEHRSVARAQTMESNMTLLLIAIVVLLCVLVAQTKQPPTEEQKWLNRSFAKFVGTPMLIIFTLAALLSFANAADAQDFDLFTWRCGNTTIEYAEEDKPESGGGAGPDTELTVRVTNPPPGKFTVQIRTTQHAISTWGAKLNGKSCVRKPYGALERPR